MIRRPLRSTLFPYTTIFSPKARNSPNGQRQEMAKLYVGNLAGQLTDSGLGELFTGRGYQVTSARVIFDREGGGPRGFGFVELGSSADAARAIGERDGSDVEGRAL